MAIAVTNGMVDPNDLKTLQTLQYGRQTAPEIITLFTKAAAGTLQAADVIAAAPWINALWPYYDAPLGPLLAKYMPAGSTPITLAFFKDLSLLSSGSDLTSFVVKKALDPSLGTLSTVDIFNASRAYAVAKLDPSRLSIADKYLTAAERSYLAGVSVFNSTNSAQQEVACGLNEYDEVARIGMLYGSATFGASVTAALDATFKSAGQDEKNLLMAAIGTAVATAQTGAKTGPGAYAKLALAKMADLVQVQVGTVTAAYDAFVASLTQQATQILAVEPSLTRDQLAARLVANSAKSGLNGSVQGDLLSASIKSTAVGKLLVETIFHADRSTIDPATVWAASTALVGLRNDAQIQGLLQKYVANPSVAFSATFYQDVTGAVASSPALAALMFEKAIVGSVNTADLLATALEIGKLDAKKSRWRHTLPDKVFQRNAAGVDLLQQGHRAGRDPRRVGHGSPDRQGGYPAEGQPDTDRYPDRARRAEVGAEQRSRLGPLRQVCRRHPSGEQWLHERPCRGQGRRAGVRCPARRPRRPPDDPRSPAVR